MTNRHAGTAATLLAMAAFSAATIASPPFDPTDADAVRQARAFQQLVLDAQPTVVGPAAQTEVSIDFGRGPVPVHVPGSYESGTVRRSVTAARASPRPASRGFETTSSIARLDRS